MAAIRLVEVDAIATITGPQPNYQGVCSGRGVYTGLYVQARGALSFGVSPVVEMPGGMVYCMERGATRLDRPCAVFS